MNSGLVPAKDAERAFSDLLRDWCDALLGLQTQDGGLLCPACGMIHGRCHEAVYPLLCVADRTGEEKYLSAAKRLFAWGENVLQSDGSVINDLQSPWKGVTAFAAIALHDALKKHGDLLTAEERCAWRARLDGMGAWLYRNLTVGAHAYINYYAANACAMALLGKFFARAEYTQSAEELADYCFARCSENGLLYGEGQPHDALTVKGCRAIDVGYNAEESLPSLVRYAAETGDTAATEQCRRMGFALLRWMLPDGAWDDSFGTRSFKWTYWGSRTSDGCPDALLTLGRTDPVFANAAWRNFSLLRRCTRDGLLSGGPDYESLGEAVCAHHTFCHAKALAGALDAGLYAIPAVPLPAESALPLRFFAELHTYRLAVGDFLADVTGYDARYKRGGHVSGGTLSLLWHRRCGVITAAGMAQYALFEPLNQQQPRFPERHAAAYPRIEAVIEDQYYSQAFDTTAVLRDDLSDDAVCITVQTTLCDPDGVLPPVDAGCKITYTFRADAVQIGGVVPPALANNARFVLPIVSDAVRVACILGTKDDPPHSKYSLSPGFAFSEYVCLPDAQGRFAVRITVPDAQS